MLGGKIKRIDAAQRAIGCFSNRTLDGGNAISIGRLPEHTEECFDLAHVNAPVRCYPSGLAVASSSKGRASVHPTLVTGPQVAQNGAHWTSFEYIGASTKLRSGMSAPWSLLEAKR